MKIVAMIPARAGSIGIPDKNVRNIGGKPMIGYAISAGNNANQIDKVYVSSNSPEYLDLSVKLGAYPHHRPDFLSQANTSMKEVVIEFAESLHSNGESFEAMVVLYPTHVQRTSEDIDSYVSVFINDPDTRPLIGLYEHIVHPYECYQVHADHKITTFVNPDTNKFYQRQSYPTCYQLSHWACVLPVDKLDTLNAQLVSPFSYGYVIPSDKIVIEIDTPQDFMLVENLILAERN